MQRVILGAVFVVMVSAGAASAGGPGKDQGNRGSAPARASAAREAGGTESLRFAAEDIRIIRTRYAPRYRNLPPGLQKKYERSGQLPPGWQKKMEPLPVEIERTLPPLPSGYRRGVIEGHAVIYHSGAGTIVDVAVLF
jgi:hypothetical protein